MFGKSSKLAAVPTAPSVNVGYPIRCLGDIPTGEFVQGRRGNYHMMGGYHDTYSITGPGNSFKTDQLLYPQLTVFSHVKSSSLGIYDTENSLSYKRFNDRKGYFPGLEDFDFIGEQYNETPRFLLWQRAAIEGDEWVEAIKDFARERVKDKKTFITLPIKDPAGNDIKIPAPSMLGVDSLSAMSSESIQQKIVDKNAIGESGANTIFMKDGAMKTQFIMQVPNLTHRYGLHFSMTAHVGNYIQMDPYAPKPVSLAFSKNGTKQKGVPEKFQFINHFVGEIYGCKPLLHPVDKSPKYPDTEADREKGNDLFQITEVSSRNKSGPSGVTRSIIVSQREGILAGLTEFDYIKETCKKLGIGGNNTTFHMDLYPDCNLQRTTIRKKIREDARLDNAIRLTAELNQMKILWKDPDGLFNITPKELHDRIIEQGYDWNTLLVHRYWWVPEEEAGDQLLNELTIMDLLLMARGEYHPYWLEDDKKTVKKQYMTPAYEGL
jgi:hypothetical protein